MKTIFINGDLILSLENIISIKLHTNGTGAKSNPYSYFVRIEYHGGEYTSTHCTDNKELAQFWINQMYEIITAE